MSSQQLAVRVNPRNQNHHLWKNNGTWWCHFTLHGPDFTKRRIRLSLATRQVADARKRRDHLLSEQAWPLDAFGPLTLKTRWIE